MIVKIFLAFLACGFGAEILAKDKYEKMLSFLLFIITAILFINFYENWHLGTSSKYIYHWVQSKYLNVNFNLSSNYSNYAYVFPFFLISLVSIINNTFYNVETQRLKLNGFVIINLCCLISLACSENLVQLLASSCVIEILGFYIINDIDARKKYIYYNLLSDIGLFMVFAIVYGRLGSVELDSLNQYMKVGAHKDLVAILLLLSVLVKSGAFLFQNQLLDLSFITFNRVIFMLYCSSPITGLIILAKTFPLLNISHYSIPMLQIFSVLTIVWGLVGCLFIDNIKEKAIYISLMFYALFYGLISFGYNEAMQALPYLLVVGFLVANLFEMISISASNETLVSKMGGFIRVLRFSFIISLLVVFVLIQTIMLKINISGQFISKCFLVAILIGLAHIFRQIFFGKPDADERVWALLKNSSIIFWLPIVGISTFIIYQNNLFSNEFWMSLGGFILFMLIGPFRKLDKIYDVFYIQEAELFAKMYDVLLITPIKILGRILWLTIDFLFIEKTIIYSVTKISNIMTQNLQRLHNSTWINYIIMTMLGLGTMLAVFYLRIKA